EWGAATGPPPPPTLGAPRRSRGAPRDRVRARYSHEPDVGAVADHELVRLRPRARPVDRDVAAYQARLDAAPDVGQHGALQHDRMLDLAAAHDDAVADGGEGADVRLLDRGAAAYDRRPADRAVVDLGAGLDDDLAEDLGALHDAVYARL